MGLFHSPKIVTDGLVLLLDAGNPKSYSGSGSNWFDLSGNKFHMSLKNSPTFVNDAGLKYFSLDGSDDYGACDGTISGSVAATPTNLGVNGAVPRSIVCVAKLKNGVGSSAGGLYDLGSTGVAGQHMSLRRNGDTTADPSSFRNNFWSTPDHDFTYSAFDWTMYTSSYGSDKKTKTFGNSGVLLGQESTAFDLVTSGKEFEMGRYANQNYNIGADIAYYMIYTKQLSDSEMKQNFDAIRGRFGL